MADIEMPHNLPKPKKMTFDIAGKRITVGASVLQAGAQHAWAKEDHPTLVLKPLGDSLSDNKEARELLGGMEHEDEVRKQAIEQLRHDLGAKGLNNLEIIMLGPTHNKTKEGGIRYV